MLQGLMPLACAPQDFVAPRSMDVTSHRCTDADQASHASLSTAVCLPIFVEIPLRPRTVQTSVPRNVAADCTGLQLFAPSLSVESLFVSTAWQTIHGLSARRVVKRHLSALQGSIVTLMDLVVALLCEDGVLVAAVI